MADPLHIDLRLALGDHTLPVSFDTSAKVTGIYGPSGVGKSSLLRAIAGLQPASGSLRFGDQVWQDGQTALAPEHRHIGWVPQDALLFPHLDVRANLLAGRARATARGHDVQALLSRVTDLLEIGPLLNRSTTDLSGGERQRVALGRALCSGPQLLLLDEATAALDAALKRRILQFLLRIRAEFDIPMIWVSHNPRDLQALCDDLVVLGAKGVQAQGHPRILLADPNVLPDRSATDFESLLPGVVVHSDHQRCRLKLSKGDAEITVLPSGIPVHAEALVAIRARDVILATQDPGGVLSARNSLRAVVAQITPTATGNLVHLDLIDAQGPHLAAHLSVQAVEELDLGPGVSVRAIFKASACALVPR